MDLCVKVADLRAGDYLPLTSRTVLRCGRGLHTPSGHHEVHVRRKNGRDEWLTWRSQTLIDIQRPDVEPIECSCDDPDCRCSNPVSVEDATCFGCLGGAHLYVDERQEEAHA